MAYVGSGQLVQSAQRLKILGHERTWSFEQVRLLLQLVTVRGDVIILFGGLTSSTE